MFIFVLIAILFLTACGHHKVARSDVPPPPAPAATPQPATRQPTPNEKPAESSELPEPSVPSDTKPLSTEVGTASWYGPPYHNRRGSNGEIYNMHAMTAAHRTFPLGSIVRVTNVKTGSSAIVRITDRGPFIRGRVVDLSLAAAQKTDVYKPGIARVKVDLLQLPVSADSPGKWAVQIGGFPDEGEATKLADQLTRKYHTAKIHRFKSPAGDWWIRVRVLGDDHERAEKLVAETTTTEGDVFLVRLD